MQPGTIWASSSYRCLHQALRTYRLATLTAPQVSFHLGVSSASHLIIVNLSLAFPAVWLSWLEAVFGVSRLLYPLCRGQRADD